MTHPDPQAGLRPGPHAVGSRSHKRRAASRRRQSDGYPRRTLTTVKAYIYASPAGAEAGVLSQCFIDFAELSRRGFLNEDSTVWANAEAPHASFWALTERSQYVYVYRSTEPGYVRLTSGRIRWARTFDDTVKKFEVDLDTKAIPGEPDKHLTLIVKHRMPGQTVKIIDESRRDEQTNGVFTKGQLTVIDLPAFKPPANPQPASEFEINHARYHGVNHMMSTLDPENAELVRKHLNLYAFDIEPETIQKLNEHLDVIEGYASQYAEVLYNRLATALNGDATDSIASA
ncbi:hypothetical protein [Mycobacterium kyorinense]|uniref:hypothetical protein n=1 Tax=Mycobacterium kyorinense TaxID=487514 RepID=UPI002011DD77|nr:hypothetical protein [Mycobacterium kyorinense]